MLNSDSLPKDFISNFFIDYSTEIIFILDNELKFKEVNKTFSALLGYTNEDLCGKSVTELFLQDDLAKFNSLDKLTGDINIFIFRLVAKDARVIWFEVRVKRTEDGFYLAIGKDFSQQKEAEEKLFLRNKELEEERARTHAMLENIGDGVIGIKDQGEISYINNQTEMLLGFTKDDLLGNLITKVIKLVDEKGEEIPINKRPVHEALFDKKKVSESKYSYLRKDGKPLPVAITASPIAVYGLVMGGVIIFRDITKEREIDRMKTEFLSLASHQLRTPLSATKWFVELVMDDDENLTDEQKDMLRNIYQSNERMIELVNALLNISRIESGRIIIEPKPTDIVKLLDEVLDELRPKLLEKKHHVGLSTHQQLPVVNIDPKLIRHVYMNLLTNAIKYTPENGQIVVMISKSGEDIISQISDNGYGIPNDQQKRIFQKFFRADNVIKVETDGSGLGLYLTKAIVESSGGKIWFESLEGKGTTFWFSLPIQGTPPKKGEVSIDT